MHIFKNVGQLLWEHLRGIRDKKKTLSDFLKGEIVHMHAYWHMMGEGGVETLPKPPH